MERIFAILIGTSLGTAFFYWFTRMVRKPTMKTYINSHLWLLHPNAICYWRTVLAFFASFLYFFTSLQSLAIIIFSFAAILDGVDGLVARSCDLGTTWGEWLDPMCDKLTYLPPLVGFACSGILALPLLWTLVAIEVFGQFLARHVLALLRISGAANNFGKIKTIICFALVIFCALREGYPEVIDIGDEVLTACIVLAAASIVFKFVPNRLYADILSTLNFCCGLASLILSHKGRFGWAITIIIIGQLFDLFDGRMAEKHGGTKYGPYLDDIADFISFGLAPAYIIVQRDGFLAWAVAVTFVCAVAYRLYRFVFIDKYVKNLPEGVFNGLPSPAGALIVLGTSLFALDYLLWIISIISAGLMVSRIRFAHFGRIVLQKTPRPVFFLICASITVTLALILKTQNVVLFGWLILCSVLLYMVMAQRLMLNLSRNEDPPAHKDM